MQSFKSEELPENPRQHSNPISSLMFCFLMPTFFKGRKRVLNESDLYRALNEHKSDYVGNKLSMAWEEQCQKCKATSEQPSLFMAILKVFGCHYITLGIAMGFIEIGLRCMQPIFLGKLVSFYTNSAATNRDKTEAYLYATGVILCSVFNVLLYHPNSLGIQHSGMKIRVALCSLIYRKALRLSKSAMNETTTGQVLNLMSNDVSRLDTSILQIHYLWIGPISIATVTYLMFLEIGISSLFGVILMLLFIPMQGFLGKKTSKYRLRTALCTDERVRMMNEIITGIQVIKMYAWEYPFGKIVEHIRRKEMKAIRYVNYIRGMFSSFIMFLARISVFASLVGFVLLGNLLTAEKAFAITAYMNVLKTIMTVYFSLGVGQFAETLVSFRRLQTFMILDETSLAPKQTKYVPLEIMTSAIVSENGKEVSLLAKETDVQAGITICKLKSKWNLKSKEFNLNDINLKIQPKTLVAVIGPVGSGKSSLLQVILGELPPFSGSLQVNGVLSFASQEPWLFTGTVRQNILFGLPMNKKRYNTTVEKCALLRDFKLLPYGDKTIVGERGASLSGGQKSRINLARAIYREADIYLLDDPLSAVDTHVARHLFDKCMKDYLREHIVILVTHQLQFLQQTDLIVIMDKGRVSAVDKYENLLQSGLDFAQLLSNVEEDGKGNESLNRATSRQRKSSDTSLISTVESMISDAPKQISESREEGKIGFKLYKKYFGSSGSSYVLVLLAIACLGCQVLSSGSDYFLSYWVNQNENILLEISRRDAQTDSIDIYIFTALNVAVIIFSIYRSFLFFNLAMKSSTTLHNAMYLGVTRAAMFFFNTNPCGRILNRFSKDMGQVDEILPSVMMDVIQIFLSLLGILVVLCLVNPWYLLVTAILVIIFYYLRTFYLKTSTDIKRLEAITRSPIYSHMAASLNGLATIRAFGAERVLISEFDNYQDLHSSAFYLFLTTSRAFGYWLDCCCVVYIAIITLSFFVFSPQNGGNVGLAITQALGMTGMVQWGIRQSAELENTMTSVERVVEFESIEAEGELGSQPDKKPSKSWPDKGGIKFDNLSLRYDPDIKSDYVLKSLNFVIKPCEKVGIVGRTGAGKSSLINALFRLSYNDGSIVIDERDINDLGLHDLRNKISIIPQEPVLFSGTMRYNLDPFDEYSDIKLWEALEEVKLKQVVSDLPNTLLTSISEGGTNFSVGQRQLVCLARAILRENRILVLDEATANVDAQTDALIQTTIRVKFQHCTVLTIAHRLHTVMDSDKVLVMDAGRVVEFGSPYELLTTSEVKFFYNMVKQTGNSNFDSLLKVAQNSYQKNLLERKVD